MIDIEELRSMVNGAQFEGFANSVIHSLLDRLEAAERERNNVAQQLVQAEIGKRKLDAECDELRVKVERMEQQEPVAEIVSFGGPDLKEVAWRKGKMPALGSMLYTSPGAKGEEK